MQCSVKNCSNNETTMREGSKITFHQFSLYGGLRNIWAEVLGMADDPKDLDIICSDHFRSEDIYVTQRGQHRIREGAIPVAVQVCRICLATDVKMYNIRNRELQKIYADVCGVFMEDDRLKDKLPEKLCWECTARLLAGARFRNKAIRTHQLLTQLLHTTSYITLRDIKSINRFENGLESNLAHHYNEPNECHILIKEAYSIKPDVVVEKGEKYNFDEEKENLGLVKDHLEEVKYCLEEEEDNLEELSCVSEVKKEINNDLLYEYDEYVHDDDAEQYKDVDEGNDEIIQHTDSKGNKRKADINYDDDELNDLNDSDENSVKGKVSKVKKLKLNKKVKETKNVVKKSVEKPTAAKKKRPKKRPLCRKIGNHTEEDMKIALEEIRSGKKIRAVAMEKKIPFSTLRRYVNKMKASGNVENIRLVPHYDVNRVFTDEQEQALTEYYKNCALMFYRLTTKDCRKVAYQMAVAHNIKMPQSWTVNRIAGVDWLRSFRKRHEVSLRKLEACSPARATEHNKATVNVFFDNLHEVYKRYPSHADGTRVYNLDETATSTVQKPQKIISTKGYNIGALVTTCCIISAAGQALPPVLIFPKKNYKDHMIKGASPGTLALASPFGWNSELFLETMKHFIKYSSSSKLNPSILIMDTHESHLCIEGLDIAKENGVTVLTLHPHAAKQLQPLDVGIFPSFKNCYNAAMESWMIKNPGTPVTIYELAELIGTAFTCSMTPKNIINAFKRTGIYPFDRNVFADEELVPRAVTNRPNPYVLLSRVDESLQNDNENPNISILGNESPPGALVRSPAFQQESGPSVDPGQDPLEPQRDLQEASKPQGSKLNDTPVLLIQATRPIIRDTVQTS